MSTKVYSADWGLEKNFYDLTNQEYVVILYHVVIKYHSEGEKKMDFGTFIKNKRIEKGLTLREFCRKTKLDPSNWSKIERGIFPPPKSRPVLEEIAAMLSLSKNSQDWHSLFDLASISFIPPELMDDAALIDKLPILFRTIRGEKLTRKELDALIEKIKES
jgi:transcriptional regulator with XRE-family HTH domain